MEMKMFFSFFQTSTFDALRSHSSPPPPPPPALLPPPASRREVVRHVATPSILPRFPTSKINSTSDSLWKQNKKIQTCRRERNKRVPTLSLLLFSSSSLWWFFSLFLVYLTAAASLPQLMLSTGWLTCLKLVPPPRPLVCEVWICSPLWSPGCPTSQPGRRQERGKWWRGEEDGWVKVVETLKQQGETLLVGHVGSHFAPSSLSFFDLF